MRIAINKEQAEQMVKELEIQNKLPDLAQEQIDDNIEEIRNLKELWQLA